MVDIHDTNLEKITKMAQLLTLNSLLLEQRSKVGCVFPMVVVSILPHAEFGPNDHRKDALHFNTEKYP